MNRKNNLQETISFLKPGGEIHSIKVKDLIGRTEKELVGNLKHDMQDFFRYGKIRDIEKFLKKYGGNIDLGHIFSNFFAKLPDGYYRTDPLYQEILHNHFLTPAQKKSEIKSGHSQLYTSSNPMVFYKAIDAAIIEHEISLEEIAKLNQKLRKEEKSNALNVLYQRLLPVYISLRKKGYSHKDFFS